MTSKRQEISKLGDVWNPTILWYARAVRQLWNLPIADRRSWRYLAAIHGFDLRGWIDQGLVEDPQTPEPQDPLPAKAEQDEMWDQCQHAGWYFLPWHRGYVAAFEAIVARTVKELGGPGDWALPYWNYFDTSNPNARRFPQAFTEPWLPDGSGNPLAWFARSPSLMLTPVLTGADITLSAMTLTRFTGNPGASALGGSPTGFAQFGVRGGGGAMENDPHNGVHVMVGGFGGYMSDANYAALDPLFWLHHCNIDRLWAAWLEQSGNVQENGKAWSDGPSPRQFNMPQPDRTRAVFTPGQTLPGGPLVPSYDDLATGTGLPPAGPAVPASADAKPKEHAMPASLSGEPVTPPTLLGSNQRAITIGRSVEVTHVKLAGGALPASATPQRLFVFLENVRGPAPSGALSVYVGLPGHAPGDAKRPPLAKTVTLFGLGKASSATSGGHAGEGLSVAVDITDIARTLTLETGAAPSEFEVWIEQPPAFAGGKITVDKVSIQSQDSA